MAHTGDRKLLAILRFNPLAVNEPLAVNQGRVLEAEMLQLPMSHEPNYQTSSHGPLLTEVVLASLYRICIVLVLTASASTPLRVELVARRAVYSSLLWGPMAANARV